MRRLRDLSGRVVIMSDIQIGGFSEATEGSLWAGSDNVRHFVETKAILQFVMTFGLLQENIF